MFEGEFLLELLLWASDAFWLCESGYVDRAGA